MKEVEKANSLATEMLAICDQEQDNVICLMAAEMTLLSMLRAVSQDEQHFADGIALVTKHLNKVRWYGDQSMQQETQTWQIQ